ncbi:MAG: ISL3 family transposase [Deltaproteobacteria bacterium]
MTLHESIIGIPFYQVEKVIKSEPITYLVRFTGKVSCPRCGGTKLRNKDSFTRHIRHWSLGGGKPVFLAIRASKYLCFSCKRYFNTRFEGILPYKRFTECFRREVFEKHHQGFTQKTVAESLRISPTTVESWYQDFLKRKIAEKKNNPFPRVLGIDEHFFSRKNGYATTFCDLSRRKVYDVVLGRSENALRPYLNSIENKKQVRVAVMDLSDTYRSIVKHHFPNALIVADRFHVIRLINHAFLRSWNQLDPIGRRNRGLLSLMRRKGLNLSDSQRVNLKQYFEKHPGLEAIYDFKENLNALMCMKHQTARSLRKLIPQLLKAIDQLLECPIEALQTLGRSLQSWQTEIARMWRFTRTNSITEGLHNKMEVISRRAYGFKNFQNYRIRVKALCG